MSTRVVAALSDDPEPGEREQQSPQRRLVCPRVVAQLGAASRASGQ
jgi:hypothetical protein